jgi:oligoendopeptidase F
MKKLLFLALWALPVMVSPAFAEEPKERSEVPAEYKWDLSSMYASDDAWRADKEKFEAMLPDIEEFKGHLADGGETLLSAIRTIEEINQIIGNLYVYAGLSSFEDLRAGENSARFSEAATLYANFQEATAFFSPELLSIDEKKLAQMIDSTSGLQMYRHSIDETLRLREHTLSESEEKILAAAGDPLGKFGNTFTALNNADMTFGEMQDEEGKTVELTKARYGQFIYSTNRQVREDAWKGLHTEYEKLGNTLAANYEGHVKGRVFLARTRGYDSALQSATYASAIPEEVYLNLVRVSREGSEQLQRYLELRRKALGVETLEVWDLYAPLVEPTLKDIPWEDAKKIVAEALQPLGPEYVELYWKGFEDGWVDVYETKGKRGGAYSWGTYSSKPYLSMNYEGTLNDVSTLAHEYGHSIHSYLTRNTQPYVYGSYRTFIAEVASMTNEAILFQKMLKEANTSEEKIFLLQTYLDMFRGSFFRQASFADFEMQAHAQVESGNGLTKESLNALYADVFSAFYGDAVSVDPLNASEWSRIPHFLRSDNFYVYQYATSFAAATALAKRILEEGEPARERFLMMLKSGSNDYPIGLLKKAGVDMTTPQPIYDTLEVFEELVNELERNLE